MRLRTANLLNCPKQPSESRLSGYAINPEPYIHTGITAVSSVPGISVWPPPPHLPALVALSGAFRHCCGHSSWATTPCRPALNH